MKKDALRRLWTPAMDTLLIEGWNSGKPASRIADIIAAKLSCEMTRDAVMGRCGRLRDRGETLRARAPLRKYATEMSPTTKAGRMALIKNLEKAAYALRVELEQVEKKIAALKVRAS